MLNRYGPWLDINIVEPNGPQSCQVRFEYYLQDDFEPDEGYVRESLEASDAVQQEDVQLCEAVQRGLRSPAYGSGRLCFCLLCIYTAVLIDARHCLFGREPMNGFHVCSLTPTGHPLTTNAR